MIPLLLMMFAAFVPQAAASSAVGEWRGESICQVRPSPCNDEKALYRVTAIAGKPDRVAVMFGKIVNGELVEMGTIDDCRFTAGDIRCEYSRGVWLLKITGDQMEGTLTLTDGTVYRRVKLSKQH